MRGDRTLAYPLTDQERELAATYHDIIYAVMREKRLPADPGCDEYGECALALIAAARRYRNDKKLQKYSFANIAYKSIWSALSNLKRLNSIECLSLDAEMAEGSTLLDFLQAAEDITPVTSPENMRRYKKVKKLFSKKIFQTLQLWSNGVSYTDCARMTGETYKAVSLRINHARKKAALIADELYPGKENAAPNCNSEAAKQ